ncbi:nucleoid-associated protein [Rhizobium leguminosarum]|uniref:nucleoid-associated protein n=1 Tax=Rhizobium ruizarguesonis TaxID=2081791 RepID=UPI001A9982CC|nr:nucleoid-associated protein [Rhizobium ruizarguesonis]MBY5891714.1 nucleoid-associated protein [Rhizobium leguminosarum]QSZ05141.1 nucleoid-associated protein [Rhizobium ruizarguesonis]
MPSLTKEEIEKLEITNFIFHVVHHGAAEPILLKQVPIGEFERFFLDRISDTLAGNRYVFLPDSVTRANLAAVAGPPDQFVDVSQLLAKRLHSEDDRIKRGVFIMIALRTGNRQLYSLIKYDHEKVVAFDLGDAVATLRDVVNSFTESPKALQKSALIELTKDGGELAIIDRNSRVGISDFFEKFLGVKRRHTETEITSEILDSTLKTVQQHQLELPPEITSRVKPRLLEIAEKRGSFEAEEFLSDFFGAHGSVEVKATFYKELERREIAGEAFNYDLDALPAGGPRKYVTNEGIRLVIPQSALSTFSQTSKDGWTTIIIRTRRVTEQ